MLLYSLALLVAIIVSSPYWLMRMAWRDRYRDSLGERFGAVPTRLRKFVGIRRTIWLHAVSVGEVTAATRLIELLDSIDPELPVVISTTTRTGQKLARERFGAERVFYYPFDFAWPVRRYLHALRPRVLVLMESELWPRMLTEANRASVPVVVVNGRVSDRSLPRYRALRRLWRPFLCKLKLVLAQTPQDADRFVGIGVPSSAVRVAGNLKFDVRASGTSEIVETLRQHLPHDARLLVVGSTLDGEEKYLLDAFRELHRTFPQLMMILAPRHPERFQAVQDIVQASGLPWVRRSIWIDHPSPIAGGSIFLLDSVGELASVYSLATVAFVGGSLVPAGGHNPLEPAQFAVPIVMGPFVENFRGMVAMLLEQEAIRITPPERLQQVLEEMLTVPAAAMEMAQRARKVFKEHAGASETCVAAISEVLAESGAQALRPGKDQ